MANKKKRRGLLVLFGVLFTAAAVFFGYLFLWPSPEQDIYNFVPQDAVFIIESEEPIDDWKEFSSSDIWQHLKQHEYFDYLDESVDYLDSLIHNHETLLGLVGERSLIISSHMVKNKKGKDDYDFLYLMDLKKGAKVTFFVDVVVEVLSKTNIPIKKGKLEDEEVLMITDETDDILYIGFVDNILLSSYSKDIMIKSFKQYKEPYFSENDHFKSMVGKIGHKGPYQIYVNYAAILPYLKLYMDDVSGMPEEVSQVLAYSSLDFRIGKDWGELKGYTSTYDTMPSVLNGMLKVGKSKVRVANILPHNTSFYTAINFRDFDDFYEVLIEEMKKDEKEWKDFEKQQNRVEKLLKIDFEEDMTSWIGNEIAVGTVPLADSMSALKKQAYFAAFRTERMSKAKDRLEYVTKRIKKKTPVKFKKDEYRDYEIRYMEMKGFFKLFLGKMFNKFEKPHFTYVDDYVVFSNDTTALHRIIDDYESRNTLNKVSEYYKFFDHFEKKSNYFIYLDMNRFFPQLMELADGDTRSEMRKNQQYIRCFERLGFQLREDGKQFEARLYTQFDKDYDD